MRPNVHSRGIIASHLTESNAVFRSILMQDLFGVLFLQKSYTISSVRLVLSEMFRPCMKAIRLGKMSSPATLDSLSARILVINLYNTFTHEMGLKSPMSEAVGVLGRCDEGVDGGPKYG